MPSKQKDKDHAITFLLKKANVFYMIPKAVVESLPMDEAFKLGLTANIELRRQLIEDAKTSDHYIENLKVVDALEISLKKLEELFPGIRKRITECDFQYHLHVGRS